MIFSLVYIVELAQWVSSPFSSPCSSLSASLPSTRTLGETIIRRKSRCVMSFFLYSHSYPSLSDMSQKGIFLARRLNENAECLISMRQGRKDVNPHASETKFLSLGSHWEIATVFAYLVHQTSQVNLIITNFKEAYFEFESLLTSKMVIVIQ